MADAYMYAAAAMFKVYEKNRKKAIFIFQQYRHKTIRTFRCAYVFVPALKTPPGQSTP